MNSMLPPLCLTIVGICVRGLAFATNVIPRGAPKDPPLVRKGCNPACGKRRGGFFGYAPSRSAQDETGSRAHPVSTVV